ncbi:GlxA family transcriptional regulator [Acidipila sp. EB88]|uniref:GlxA family transcriptional regulator n=1 Tax=Acidipila sp. EB88 TaxID=2305226 RepID=UPI001F365F1F|nr:helix-turn-helix domain-containing protein [Acidipila sp. EB88]
MAMASVFSYPKIEGKPAYQTRILCADAKVEAHGRGGLVLSHCIPYSEYSGSIDTLVILGGESAFAEPRPEVLRWIRRRAPHVQRLVGVCVGVFLLAPTGLLDDKVVTTHWHHAPKLAALYPHLKVDRDRVFIKDGNVYTTAGVTAGIDLALEIVEEDLGGNAAATIAHTLVLYLRRPSMETQYSRLLAQQADVRGTPLRDLPAWVKANLTEKLDVSALANSVSMTPRTFARQFEVHFRTTPARWIQSLRIEAACSLLATKEQPLKIIAGLTGFKDEQSLRRAFIQQLKLTPKEYRDRFGSLRMPDTE